MKLLFLVCSIGWFFNAQAQAPFASFKQKKLITKTEFQSLVAKQKIVVNGETLLASQKDDLFKLYQYRLQQIDSIKKEDYFEHANANVVFIQDAKKMFPTINGEIINYRLGIWTYKKFKENSATTNYKKTDDKTGFLEKNEAEPVVVHLPFSIISKVSGNYLDAAAGTTTDATSFFGAPLTFRLSPVIELLPNNFENKLFVGMHTDLRLLVIGDTIANKLETGWGAYTSVGATYMGKGYAVTSENENEEKKYNGKWSISAMLYYFKGGGTFNKAVFGNYEATSLSGLEVLFRFRSSKKEDSKFNFIIGASNGFTRNAPNFAQWEFKIGVGS